MYNDSQNLQLGTDKAPTSFHDLCVMMESIIKDASEVQYIARGIKNNILGSRPEKMGVEDMPKADREEPREVGFIETMEKYMRQLEFITSETRGILVEVGNRIDPLAEGPHGHGKMG